MDWKGCLGPKVWSLFSIQLPASSLLSPSPPPRCCTALVGGNKEENFFFIWWINYEDLGWFSSFSQLGCVYPDPGHLRSWNNGKDGGLLRYRKLVPQQLGDVADMQLTNGSVAQWHGSQSHRLIIFAVRVWSAVVHLLSRRGRTCEI